MNRMPQPQQIPIDPSSGRDVVCTKCGHIYFSALKRVKFISRLANPSGQDLFAHMDVLVCSSCGAELDMEAALKTLSSVISPAN